MARLEALIFDVDGTLADTERDGHRLAFNNAFAEAGLDWDWTVELYGELLAVTGGKERIDYYLKCYNADFVAPGDRAGFIAGLHAAKTRHYLTLLAKGAVPLRPGVRRLLQEARGAGLRLAIATTTTRENIDSLISETLGREALGWFEVIAAGDIVPAKKPAPDIYHYTLNAMHLAPESALAFEDSANGLQSAKGAGLRTVITINDYTQHHDFSGADIVLDCLGEPDEPCRILHGNLDGSCWVDLNALQRLHAHA